MQVEVLGQWDIEVFKVIEAAEQALEVIVVSDAALEAAIEGCQLGIQLEIQFGIQKLRLLTLHVGLQLEL